MATSYSEQTTDWSATPTPLDVRMASSNATSLDATEQTTFASNVSFPASSPLWPSGEMWPMSPGYCLATGVLLIIMAIVASVGNLVVIVVLARQRRGTASSPGVTQVFILNLAASHLLLSLLCTPLEVSLYLSGGRWVLGDSLCKVFVYLNAALITSAVNTLNNIAIERFYSVVYPLQRKMTSSKRRAMIIFSWLYAVLLCFPASFALQVLDYNTGQPACEIFPYPKRILVISGTVIIFIMPVLVTGVAYFWVWKAFRRSQRKVNVAAMLRTSRAGPIPSTFLFSATEKRLLKTLLVMMSSFVILWTPAITARVLWITETPLSANFLLTSAWISRAQPALDPFIYGYVNNQLRRGLRDLLGLKRNSPGGEGGVGAGGEGGVFVMHGRQEAAKSPPEVHSLERCLSRSMFDSRFRQVPAPQGALSTVTGHDGHTHVQINDEMEAYIRRSSCHMPRISRVAVRMLPEVPSPPPKAIQPSGSVCRTGSPATRRRGKITQVEPVNENEISGKTGEQQWVDPPREQNGKVYPSVTLNHAHDVLRVEQQSNATPRLPRRSVVCSNVKASHKDTASCPVMCRPPLGINRLPPIPFSIVSQKPCIDATKDDNMISEGTASTIEQSEFKPRRKRRKILSKRIREKALKAEIK